MREESSSLCCVLWTKERRRRKLPSLLRTEKCFMAAKHTFWQILCKVLLSPYLSIAEEPAWRHVQETEGPCA